jgi:hypothetical protein
MQGWQIGPSPETRTAGNNRSRSQNARVVSAYLQLPPRTAGGSDFRVSELSEWTN